ncbi:cytochrome P450 [Cytidiella melzeri]|nr:cytochrome P450 [Cytidiella melzeri]
MASSSGMGLRDLSPNLPLRDVLVAYIATSLATHYSFKRWEPSNIQLIASLLLIPPLPLTLLVLPHVPALSSALVASYHMFFAMLAASIIAYRLSPFHPLARYPGPLMCKVSKWWIVWETRGGVQHLWYQRLHQIYGDAVRVGPNELSLRDSSLLTAVMGTTGLPKGPSRQAQGMYPEVQSLIMYRDPAEHSRRRKPWNRAFNSTALKEYHPIISRRVSQLVERIASQDGAIDLSLWLSWFTYDFMSDLAFGGGSAMLQNGDGDDLWHILKSGLAATTVFEQVSWLPHILKILPALKTRAIRMRALGINRAQARLEAGSQTKDIFYYLSNEDGVEKQNPPKPVVISDGFLAVIAGSDSTATVLSAAFWGMLSRPDIYQRLRMEVDRFFPPEENSTINRGQHAQMVFLEAVINESLRLFPPGPSGSQRAPPVGRGDRVIGQYHIPEGTNARLHTWSMHRDPRNFSHPDTFWPARWLIASGLEESKEPFVHNANAFIPFSFGPTNCVGKQLAMQEMRTVICHVIQRLDLRLADDWDPTEYEKEYKDFTVASVGRLPVLVQLRKRGAS